MRPYRPSRGRKGKVIGERLDGVPARERYDVLGGNMVRAYGLPQALEVPA